ncbi:MAG: type II secretion system protein, partial [Thermodesulfobacteria bacterium]|nr:type II secretion system protein [Thermodesulfobacteriota bacterium]
MNARRGFTLVELAITLVIVGLLLGMGASLFGILVKQKKHRENENRLEENAATLVQYALEHRGRLPGDCTTVLRYPKDAYGKPFLCLVAPELKVYSACARRTTSLRVMDQEAGASHENVAFVLVSGGKNYNIQTRATSPVTIYPFEKEDVDDYPDDFNRPEPYDDQVYYLLLAELKEKLLCHRSEERLRILNET